MEKQLPFTGILSNKAEENPGPPHHPCFSAFYFSDAYVPMVIVIYNVLAYLQISSIGTESSYVIVMVHLLAETVKMRYI